MNIFKYLIACGEMTKYKVICVLCCMHISVGFADNNSVSQYELQAVFLEKITRFIDWPENSRVTDKSQLFQLCVIGTSPMTDALQHLSEIATIKGKEITVLANPDWRVAGKCDLAFIGKGKAEVISKIVDVDGFSPLLTIGDTPGYAEKGVIINFYEDAGRVRFEINVAEARQRGFRVSSRLLKLARVVGNEGN